MPESAIQLSTICELLGSLWLKEVDLDMLQALRTKPFAETYQTLGGYIPESADEAMVETLAIEYCELLIGPKGQISPVESVWAEEQLQSKQASSMHRFFELVPNYHFESGFPDHIGVQLDFASSLVRHEDDIAKEEILNHFVKTHFGWMPKFLNLVIKQTKSEFYRGLATVTENLIGTLESPSQFEKREVSQ